MLRPPSGARVRLSGSVGHPAEASDSENKKNHAMTITRQPNDFTPLSEGQVFAFDTGETTPTDVEVHVIDMGSFQTITRQKLFGVTSGEIDVAPYIGRMLDAEPCTDSGSVLKAAPHVCYTVTFNDVRSDKIYTCLNKAVPALPSWLSTMTQQRRLLYGERDEVLLFGPRGSVFEVLLVADAGTDVSLTCAGECGAALFCLDTLDYPEGVRSIEAWFTCNGEELLTIFYTVERDRGTGVRLAWISSAGSIERYTFPIVRNTMQSVVRESITGDDGLPVTVGCTTEQTLRLVSDYERRAVAGAVAEVAQSPKVWRECGRVLSRVEVTTASATLYEFGRPDCVEVDIRTRRREVMP